MKQHPLAEVFGFPIDNMGRTAQDHRKNRLCPFGNVVPRCTKDKADDPLGVCSIYDGGRTAITCPIRFNEDGLITNDAASFFFGPGTRWETLTEVRLKDRYGKSAGNIDIVVVAYDERGRVTDFGAIEKQGVYISGNVRNPFSHYMEDPIHRKDMDWRGQPGYPGPDYLSSSRKRLAPQLIFKGGILRAWNKKIAVVLDKGFFGTLPKLDEVDQSEADVAWLVYDLEPDADQGRLRLRRQESVFTKFEEALSRITVSEVGDVDDFVSHLQAKIDRKLADE